jgi:hypothetical protein
VVLSGIFLGRGALSCEVAQAAIVKAGRAGGGASGRCRRWCQRSVPEVVPAVGGALLMLVLRWAGNTLLLVVLLALVLLLTGWVSGAMVVHHLVPGRSTAGRSYHNLPLLCFLVGANCLIHSDDITDKL